MTAGHTVVRRGELSASQQSLWLLEQFGAAGAYHNLLSVLLYGPVDRPALAASLAAVTGRHEALRTRFASGQGAVWQEVLPEVAVPLADLTEPEGRPLPAGQALARAGEWCRAPFAFGAAPLLRASLTPLDDAGHLLTLAAHHLVSDGDSMTIILRELFALYQAQVCGTPGPLPPPAAQFLDVADAHIPASARVAAGLRYWHDHLAGAPSVLDLPLDRPRPARPSYTGATRQWRFQPGTVAAVRELARTQQVSVFMIVLAMLGVLLSRLAGTGDIVIGVPMSLRRTPQSREAVGYLVNTIAVRLTVDPAATVEELLTDVRRTTLRGYDRSHVPFEAVVKQLRPPRRIDHNPLFQVLLAFTDRGGTAHVAHGEPIAGLRLEFPAVEPGTSRADVSFCVHEVDGSLAVDVEHAADLCDPATAASLAHALEGLLAAAAADPGRRVGALPLLRPSEPGHPSQPGPGETRQPRAGGARVPGGGRQVPPPAGPDPLTGLLDEVLAAAGQAPDRAVLACPDCVMSGAELRLACGRPIEAGRSGRTGHDITAAVVLGRAGSLESDGMTCPDVAVALRRLRTAPAVAGRGAGGRRQEPEPALAFGAQTASRASLAAAAGWLRSPRSPLRRSRRVVVCGPVTPTALAICLAQLADGGQVVLAPDAPPTGSAWDGPAVLAGSTAALLGWMAAAPAWVAGVIVTGEPPLVRPWQRLAARAGGCPVSYLGGPVFAAGVALAGDVTSGTVSGRLLGRPVGTAGAGILAGNGAPVPAGLPGTLRCWAGRDDHGQAICQARVTGSGELEMTGPLAPPGVADTLPLCQVEGVLAGIDGVADAEAFWAGGPGGDRYLAAAVVAEPGERLTAADVAAELRRRLAPHLVPARLRVAGQLAQRPDGWLARHADDRAPERRIGARLLDALKA